MAAECRLTHGTIVNISIDSVISAATVAEVRTTIASSKAATAVLEEVMEAVVAEGE